MSTKILFIINIDDELTKLLNKKTQTKPITQVKNPKYIYKFVNFL